MGLGALAPGFAPCAFHRQHFYLEMDDARLAQLGKHLGEHAGLGPAVHPGVHRMPVAKMLGQIPPGAVVGHHVQNGVEHLPVGQADIAALQGKAMCNPGKLLR